VKALKSSDIREAAAGFGFELYDSDLARVSKIIRDAGITTE
jgi:hypothetical protein